MFVKELVEPPFCRGVWQVARSPCARRPVLRDGSSAGGRGAKHEAGGATYFARLPHVQLETSTSNFALEIIPTTTSG